MRALQFGELATFARVVGKFVVGECGAGNDVGSHCNTSGDLMRGIELGLRNLLRERIENDVEQKIQGQIAEKQS